MQNPSSSIAITHCHPPFTEPHSRHVLLARLVRACQPKNFPPARNFNPQHSRPPPLPLVFLRHLEFSRSRNSIPRSLRCRTPPNTVTMAPSQPLKTTFRPSKVVQPYYSGGAGCVALDRSGRLMVTAYGDEAVITDIESGAEIARIDGVCREGRKPRGWNSLSPQSEKRERNENMF